MHVWVYGWNVFMKRMYTFSFKVSLQRDMGSVLLNSLNITKVLPKRFLLNLSLFSEL